MICKKLGYNMVIYAYFQFFRLIGINYHLMSNKLKNICYLSHIFK